MVGNVSEICVRIAEPCDAQAIATLHIASWKVAYKGLLPDQFLDRLDVENRAQRWDEILAKGESTTILAISNDQIVGFSSCGPSRDGDGDVEQSYPPSTV